MFLLLSHRYFTPPSRTTRNHWQAEARLHRHSKPRLQLTPPPPAMTSPPPLRTRRTKRNDRNQIRRRRKEPTTDRCSCPCPLSSASFTPTPPALAPPPPPPRRWRRRWSDSSVTSHRVTAPRGVKSKRAAQTPAGPASPSRRTNETLPELPLVQSERWSWHHVTSQSQII